MKGKVIKNNNQYTSSEFLIEILEEEGNTFIPKSGHILKFNLKLEDIVEFHVEVGIDQMSCVCFTPLQGLAVIDFVYPKENTVLSELLQDPSFADMYKNAPNLDDMIAQNKKLTSTSVTNLPQGNFNLDSSGTMGTTASSTCFYSAPRLVDTIVTDKTIELVYQRQSMISSGWGMPNPEVYKEVYSRFDGSKEVVFGKFVPAQSESYEFD